MGKVMGVDILVKVNTGTEGAPTWTTIGGQRDLTLNLGTDEIDTTSKDSNGWKESEPGNREWSVDFDGLLVSGDTAVGELEDAYFEQAKVMVQVAFPSGATRSGSAVLTELEIEGPHDAEATISGTLSGSGALSESSGI